MVLHMESAGAAVAAIREAQGLSQRELARLAKVNAGYLSQVEAGKVSPSERWLSAVKTALAQNLAGAA